MSPVPPNVSRYVVPESATLEDAMLQIEENTHRSVVVVDGDRVVGMLSDGDARKAILDKRLLSTPVRDVMNVNFVSLTPDRLPEAGRVFALPFIFLIPVVDAEMRLVDVLTAF